MVAILALARETAVAPATFGVSDKTSKGVSAHGAASCNSPETMNGSSRSISPVEERITCVPEYALRLTMRLIAMGVQVASC